ncbi:MAG: hypothetical protein Q9180_009866 [Flavoplaca navasiana]
MPQVDIQKELLGDKEQRQPILDGWLELRDHERLLIGHMVNDLKTHTSVMRLRRTYADITFRGIIFKDIPQLHFIMDQRTKKDQDRGKDVARAGWRARTRYNRLTRLSNVSTEDELPNIERELMTPSVRGGKYPSLPRSHHHGDSSVSMSPPSSPTRRRQGSPYQPHSHTSPSPNLDTELQRSMYSPEALKTLEEFEKSKKSEAPRQPGQIHYAPSPWGAEQSRDRDDSSIMSCVSMNDEEAEKAVEELLAKYTTLGSVAGGIA